jgi:hypothetical protein
MIDLRFAPARPRMIELPTFRIPTVKLRLRARDCSCSALGSAETQHLHMGMNCTRWVACRNERLIAASSTCPARSVMCSHDVAEELWGHMRSHEQKRKKESTSQGRPSPIFPYHRYRLGSLTLDSAARLLTGCLSVGPATSWPPRALGGCRWGVSARGFAPHHAGQAAATFPGARQAFPCAPASALHPS